MAHVNAECRITNLEIFYDPHELMAQLTNSRNFSSAEPVHIPQPLGGASFHPDDMNADEVCWQLSGQSFEWCSCYKLLSRMLQLSG